MTSLFFQHCPSWTLHLISANVIALDQRHLGAHREKRAVASVDSPLHNVRAPYINSVYLHKDPWNTIILLILLVRQLMCGAITWLAKVYHPISGLTGLWTQITVASSLEGYTQSRWSQKPTVTGQELRCQRNSDAAASSISALLSSNLVLTSRFLFLETIMRKKNALQTCKGNSN